MVLIKYQKVNPGVPLPNPKADYNSRGVEILPNILMVNIMGVLKFYDVKQDYSNFLRKYDKNIPYIKYDKNNKFLCGIVLKVNEFDYYVPVSSNKNKFMSSFMIYNTNSNIPNVPLSSLRFSFMFPCNSIDLKEKNVKLEQNFSYRNLMQIEYQYCNTHIEQIERQANRIYKLSLDSSKRERYNLCNFKLLEEKCIEWKQIQSISNEVPNFSFDELVDIYDKLEDKSQFKSFVLNLDK